MITHCLKCDTYFRVTPEQLAAHGGQVRCGRCGEVFDGANQIESEPDDEQTELESALVEPLAQPIMVPDEVEAKRPRHKEIIPPTAKPSKTAQVFTEIPSELPRKKSRSRPASKPLNPQWLWLAGILLLLASLTLQAAYFFRNELVAYNPELRPILEQVCRGLQCEIQLLHNPDLINIEASDLVSEPSNPDIITVNITLRNRANFPQAHPWLELTLTDAQNALVARRIFKPVEYVRPPATVAEGMLPNGELIVNLRLQLENLKAAGYRVYVFYPE